MSTRWQYKVVEVKPRFIGVRAPQVEATLSALGQQGWELVSAVQAGFVVMLYLKRPQ